MLSLLGFSNDTNRLSLASASTLSESTRTDFSMDAVTTGLNQRPSPNRLIGKIFSFLANVTLCLVTHPALHQHRRNLRERSKWCHCLSSTYIYESSQLADTNKGPSWVKYAPQLLVRSLNLNPLLLASNHTQQLARG